MEARRMLRETRTRGGTLGQVLEEKWGRMLRNITEKTHGRDWRTVRQVAAILLENQAQHLEYLRETTSSSDVAPAVVKKVLAIVRRAWPNMIANKIFSVQPLNGPVGAVFYYKVKAATSKGGITAGDELPVNFDVYWTSEYVNGETVGNGDGATTNFAGNVSYTPVKPASNVQVGIEFVYTSGGAQKRIYDADGSGTLTGDGSGTINYETGAFSITCASAPDAGTAVVANYYFSMEGRSDNVPKLDLEVQMEPVTAQSRKLVAEFTLEAAEDMKAVLGLDMESEEVDAMVKQIALERDREMVMTAYGANTSNTAVFDAAVPAGRDPVSHYAQIVTILDKMAQRIHQDTARGPGNWIVCAPDVAVVIGALEKHGDFRSIFSAANPTPLADGTVNPLPIPDGGMGYGIYLLGVLQNRWVVYVDTKFPAGKLLMGLKGSSLMDAGLIYAPYVPIELTPSFLNPADFKTLKGARTRYAKKLVRPEYYAKLDVLNTP